MSSRTDVWLHRCGVGIVAIQRGKSCQFCSLVEPELPIPETQEERLRAILNAVCSPSPDSNFDDEQNEYRKRAVQALQYNGWVAPEKVGKARWLIRELLDGVIPFEVRLQLERISSCLQ